MSKQIYKLGGNTLKDPATLDQTLDRLDLDHDVLLVVSAPGGMTDQLEGFRFGEIRARLNSFCDALLDADEARTVIDSFNALQNNVHSLSRAERLAHGELWSIRFVSAWLDKHGYASECVDARQVIVTGQDGPAVRVNHRLLKTNVIQVITGFIASDTKGHTTTLGRDGSDYTAALIAAAIGARRVDFVTDTDGIRTGDPALIDSETLCLGQLSYEEARRVAKLGGGVLHDRCIAPLETAGIPARVYKAGTHYPATVIGQKCRSPIGLGVFAGGDAIRVPIGSASARRAVARSLHGSTEEDCVVVATTSDERANTAKQVHRRLYQTPQKVRVHLYGPGSVGTQLLALIAEEQLRVRAVEQIALTVSCITDSKSTVWLSDNGDTEDHMPADIIIDATASHDIANQHARWLAAGVRIVTANKLALSGDSADWRCLLDSSDYFASATVGAGLPIIDALRDRRFEGINGFRAVLSGSVNTLLDLMTNKGHTFSKAVSACQAQDIMEPDPAEDLSGRDVLRKALILARHLGIDVRASDVRLEPVTEEVVDAILATDKRPGYVAELHDGQLSIRVRPLDRDDTLCQPGVGNAVEFFADETVTLSIAGPGAGARTTATALLRDTLRAARACIQWRGVQAVA